MAGVCRDRTATRPPSAIPLETCAIWDESGFWPPWSLALGVELLHHISMVEDTPDEPLGSLAYDLLAWLHKAYVPWDGYIITDPAEMIRTAIAYGVPVAGRRPEEIAQEIVHEIVADYLPDRKCPDA